MVKGCERRIIHLKNTGSEMFEEAYFILNDKYRREEKCGDMVKEANRIIEENLCREGLSLGEGGLSRGVACVARIFRRVVLPVVLGAVLGSLITALVILI